MQGKTFKVIPNLKEQSAVVDAQVQKRVAVLRIEMRYQNIRNFDDLTKQRAKTVTIDGKSRTRSAKQAPQSMFLSSHHVDPDAVGMKVKSKNAFELAMEKAEKNRQAFIERIRLS